MKILVTNHQLSQFQGSEWFTHCLVIALKKKGHKPYVFTPMLGGVSKALEYHKIPISDKLDVWKNIKFDVIHAQHNITALYARSLFPSVPMVYMSHGPQAQLEQPPSLDIGISHYFAVSEEVRSNLMNKYSIPRDKITIVRNIIDTDLFSNKIPAREELTRLLVISNHYLTENRQVIEKVCKDLNIHVRHIGLPYNSVSNTYDYINCSDLVITIGRGALEAMSCGRNVLAYDHFGSDGLVDENNFYELRKKNFSGRTNHQKYDSESLKQVLGNYNVSTGEKLRNLVIKENSIDKNVDKMIKIYQTIKGTNLQITYSKNFLQNEIKFFFEVYNLTAFRLNELEEAHKKLVIKNKYIKELKSRIDGLTHLVEYKRLKNRLKRVITGYHIKVAFNKAFNHMKECRQRLKVVNDVYGFKVLVRRLINKLLGKSIGEENNVYEKWINGFEQKQLNKDLKRKEDVMKSFKANPKISILMPVYNVDGVILRKAIESVKSQWYKNWELCIYNDCSIKKSTLQFLQSLEEDSTDKRIKIKHGQHNKNISLATNECFDMSTGEYVLLMDNDDLISPNCLYEVVKLINRRGSQNLIYFDEDKLSQNNKRVEPFFRPDYSPELLLSIMYPTHAVFSSAIFKKVGKMRPGYEGSQDYDLVLRVVEASPDKKISHIPKILYHWRKTGGSTALAVSEKSYSMIVAKKALQEALYRRNVCGSVTNEQYPFVPILDIDERKRVNIYIWGVRSRKDLLKSLVSIEKHTNYDRYEIFILLGKITNSEIRSISREFNNVKFIQQGFNDFVRGSSADYIIRYKSGAQVKTGKWLEHLISWLQFSDIAIACPSVITNGGSIKLGGIVLNPNHLASRVLFRPVAVNTFNSIQLQSIRNFIAFDLDFAAIKKDAWELVGGFDYKQFPNYYGVDFSVKLYESGKRGVVLPHVEIYMHDIVNGHLKADKKEINAFKRRWDKYINDDPYYNPNLNKEVANGLLFSVSNNTT